MRAYRVELLIVDHVGIGGTEIEAVLENETYPNRCISPRVMQIEGKEIGQWSDDHPLNQPGFEKEYERLFRRSHLQ